MAELSKRRTIWLLPALGLLVIGGAWLVFQLMFPPFKPPVLPLPNGYDALIRAATMLAPRTGFFGEMGEEELSAVVEQNAPALKLAREALQQECVVSVDWSADQPGLEAHMENVSSLRGLARAFAAAARLANSDGQMERAVKCGLDTLELAQNIARGGLVIDREMAKGAYYGAVHSLREQVEQLSRDDCLRLQQKLAASPLELEMLEDVFRRDGAYFRKLNGQFQSLMMVGVMRSQHQQMMATMRESERRIEVLNKLLQTHLALHAYQLDKNRFPETLDELVPGFLGEVPQDGYTVSSLVYRPLADSYLLYSVGPDGIDDRGVKSTDGKTGDLLLEVRN